MDINVEAAARMEYVAREVLKQPVELQNAFYETIKKTLGEKDAETVMRAIGYYEMFTDERKYKAIQAECLKQYLEAIKAGE